MSRRGQEAERQGGGGGKRHEDAAAAEAHGPRSDVLVGGPTVGDTKATRKRQGRTIHATANPSQALREKRVPRSRHPCPPIALALRMTASSASAGRPSDPLPPFGQRSSMFR